MDCGAFTTQHEARGNGKPAAYELNRQHPLPPQGAYPLQYSFDFLDAASCRFRGEMPYQVEKDIL
ncbi:MAG: hypothetical protein WCW53_07665 [Syntrophales bacterium]|jgi:hypothetical protein